MIPSIPYNLQSKTAEAEKESRNIDGGRGVHERLCGGEKLLSVKDIKV